MKVHLADERLRVHAILACLPRNLPTNSTLTRAKSNEQTRVPSLFLRLALFPSPILRETRVRPEIVADSFQIVSRFSYARKRF